MTVVAEALRSPYKGLSAFDDTDLDALLFFGREQETEIVVANALASRLTVLYGPSGVGKSSLLRAGVVRSLRELSDADPVGVAYLSSWSGDPVAAIATAARGALADAAGGDPGDAPGDLADQLDAWTSALGCDLLLIFDQFEELFLYHAEGGLLELLPELVTRPGLRVNVVLGIRDDELARLDIFKARIPGLFSNYLRLDLLDRESARAAVLGPLERYNQLESADVEIEPALVDAVLGQVAAGRIDTGSVGRGAAVEEDRTRIETPYLQLVLQRLWEVERERRSPVLQLATLAALGGAQQIVEDHLEHAMSALTPREQDVAAGMFDHLVTPSGAKIAHGVPDLASFAHVDAAQLEPVLHSLSRERILRPTGDDGHAGDRYEIYHDVLAGAVLAWRAKHDAERALAAERIESRRRQRRLAIVAGIALAAFALMAVLTIYAYSERNNANHQTALAKHQTALARLQRANAVQAVKLAKAATRRETRARHTIYVQKLQVEDLYEQTKASAAAERRQKLRADEKTAQANQANGELSQTATALQRSNTQLTAANDAAVQATNQAKAQTAKAVQATHQTTAGLYLQKSLAELATNPVSSVNDALRSTQLASLPGAEDVLRSALLANHDLADLPAGGPAADAAYSPDGSKIAVADSPGKLSVFSVPGGRLLASFPSDSALNNVAWSPDGLTVVAGEQNGTVGRWDVGTKTQIPELRPGGPVVAIAVSPDGRTIATAGGQSAKLWDAASGVLEATLPHAHPVRAVSFSSDGKLLLTVSNESAAHVWDVATGQPLWALPHNAQVTAAAFEPGGSRIVTGSRDNTAKLWDGRTGALLGAFVGHTSQVVTVAFSPLGDKVATGSIDGSVRVWSTTTFGLLDLRLLSGPVVSVAFAPDGQSVVAADNTGRAITFGPAQLQMELLGQPGTMRKALFAPNLRTVATVAGSTVRLWEPYGEPWFRGIHRSAAVATSVTFDPSGKLLASGDANGDVLIQKVQGQPLRTLAFGSPVVSLAWARDGMLLIGSKDGTAHLRAGAGDSDTRAIEHGSALVGAALRDDGAVVATAGTDGFVRLWDAHTGRKLLEVQPPTGLTSVALDPTGRLVAAGAGRAIAVYNAHTGKRLALLHGHLDTVTGVTFSRDGSQLASSSRDHDARIWDAKSLTPAGVLRRHTSAVSGVAFSADGRWLATAGATKAGVWAARDDKLLRGRFMFFVRGNQPPIDAVAFSPHGWELASASRDGSIRVLNCQLCGRLANLESYAKARLSSSTR